MRLFKQRARTRAIRRGLAFIYGIACDPAHFADYGSDLLNCFYFIAATSRDPDLRRTARRMGRERARQWRRVWPALPSDADADTILDLMHGSLAADLLGVRDPAFKAQLQRAARNFDARDYLCFEPQHEPPPADVPDQCDGCGRWHKRGRKACRRCRRPLTMLSRYGVWYDALNRLYTASRYGVTLGAHYTDVLKWLPTLRPYRGRERDRNPDFYDSVYAVTHLIYTLNGFSRYRLDPRWLPAEFAFLQRHVATAIAMKDAEMCGELLDTLKSFGLTDADPLLRKGLDYLLAQQNGDGSWGDTDTDDDDIYARYHPTWTAIDGLRDYAWRGLRLSLPKLAPLLARLNETQASPATPKRNSTSRK
ncbi:MAG: hypothetical protein DMF64_10440 [Acidobacteria bacterium]|nr:MAG: hypothetical protein DMF64_10440 [Acidobacteriota bacterium]